MTLRTVLKSAVLLAAAGLSAPAMSQILVNGEDLGPSIEELILTSGEQGQLNPGAQADGVAVGPGANLVLDGGTVGSLNVDSLGNPARVSVNNGNLELRSGTILGGTMENGRAAVGIRLIRDGTLTVTGGAVFGGTEPPSSAGSFFSRGRTAIEIGLGPTTRSNALPAAVFNGGQFTGGDAEGFATSPLGDGLRLSRGRRAEINAGNFSAGSFTGGSLGSVGAPAVRVGSEAILDINGGVFRGTLGRFASLGFGSDLSVSSSGVINARGGDFTSVFVVGGDTDAGTLSTLNLFGESFEVDGSLVDFGDTRSVLLDVEAAAVDPSELLTRSLTVGFVDQGLQSFELLRRGGVVRLNLVPEPLSASVLAVGLSGLLLGRRKRPA